MSLLFSLVPLLDVRHVKPSLLLRDEARVRRPDVMQIVVTVLVVAGLVGLTVWQAGSLRIGSVVAGGLRGRRRSCCTSPGTLLLRAIAPLARSRSFALRHAVLQLSRPGSQMRIVLLAVGLGSFFIIGVRSLQENLVDQFAVRMTADSPDMFLLDVQRDQVKAVEATIAAHLDRAPPRRRWCRCCARASSAWPGAKSISRTTKTCAAAARSAANTPSPTARSSSRTRSIVAGQMWDADAVRRAGSVDRAVHQRVVQDQRRRHGPLRRARPRDRRQGHERAASSSGRDSRAGGFMFLFRPGVLEQAPHSFIGFLRGPQDARRRAPAADGARRRAAPNVSVIDGREIIDAIKSVVDNVTLAVTVVGTLVRAQRPDDPDRRGRDDEVPARL